MRYLLAAIVAFAMTSVAAAQMQAVPRLSDIYADEIWVIHRGHKVRVIDVDAAKVFTVRGPRGGEITFCPPGGCPPSEPEVTPGDPPPFDMPEEPKEEPQETPPEVEAAPPVVELPVDDGSVLEVALPAGGLLAGLFGGYFLRKEDEPQDDEVKK